MKKNILVLGAIVIAGASVFTSCKKDDTTAPELTLNGDAEISINLGDTYNDAGATATDDRDKDIQSRVVTTGTVDNTKCGTYTITYNVSDEAGNPATEIKRTVKVKSDKLAGTYSVSDIVTGAVPSSGNGTYSYNVTVTQSTSEYNRINISNFGGFGTGVTVYATVEGSNITIPTQALTGDPQFSGSGASNVSGTGTYNGGQFKITSINYTCSNAMYGNGNATYTKQ